MGVPSIQGARLVLTREFFTFTPKSFRLARVFHLSFRLESFSLSPPRVSGSRVFHLSFRLESFSLSPPRVSGSREFFTWVSGSRVFHFHKFNDCSRSQVLSVVLTRVKIEKIDDLISWFLWVSYSLFWEVEAISTAFLTPARPQTFCFN
jgi:hypothetical protein